MVAVVVPSEPLLPICDTGRGSLAAYPLGDCEKSHALTARCARQTCRVTTPDFVAALMTNPPPPQECCGGEHTHSNAHPQRNTLPWRISGLTAPA